MITNTIKGVSTMEAKQRTILRQGERIGPDPEVPEKPTRRRFTAEYKLRILHLADACNEPGSVGALLRREGLYSSHLTMWRRQRERGALDGLKPKKRGRKADERNPLLPEVERLRKENEQLTKRLKQAELIIEVQKKSHRCWRSPWKLPREARATDGRRGTPGP
jgi:transposase-like protein